MNKDLIWQSILAELKNKGRYDPESKFYQFIPTSDKSYGFKNPQIREIATRVLKQTEDEIKFIELIDFLWEKNIWEAKKVAIEMLFRFKIAPIKKIKIVEGWIERIDNWETADSTSLWVVGRAIFKEPSITKKMVSWSKSKNKWKRRMSVVSLTVLCRKNKVCDEIYQVIKNLVNDSEREVQMAVGWLIREAGKKETEKMTNFLKDLNLVHPNAKRSIRYAAKKSIKTMPQQFMKFLDVIIGNR